MTELAMPTSVCEEVRQQSEIPTYYRYWGKAGDDIEKSEPYHLLAYHSLDVAAAGEVLLSKRSHMLQRLADLMQLSAPQAQRWCVFLLGVHDLGKFAETFQRLKPDLREHFWPELAPHCKNYSLRHDSLGQIIWQQHIKRALYKNLDDDESLQEFIDENFKLWMQAVTGHHGYPPNAKDQPRRHFCSQDQEASLEFFQDWQRLLGIDFTNLKDQQAVLEEVGQGRASWLLAGIAVLCDWLGSNREKFAYHTENCGLALPEYWQNVALPTAAKALEESGLLPASLAHTLEIKQLFDYITQPTPLQTKCAQLAFDTSPQLFILEDVTGAGKTEAALMLAHRILDKKMAEGFYIGLPTMATANAMYERMAASYRAFYQADATPSLILSHGARHLSARFRQALLPVQREGVRYEQSDENISAQCNRWLADNRKKALLADVGVGTIDQALLGILPVRHQSLRLLGLANKVLILDEVHAYDAYTGELLKALVEFHTALGGSVILLSATLTLRQREELVRTFGAKNFISQKPATYPLLTRASSTGEVEEIALQTREAVRREVDVQFLHDDDAVLEHIRTASLQGQCICWIRNTVADARAAFTALQDALPTAKLHLFHSRYALHDRLQIEAQVLALFGKDSTPAQRNGRVLIATQVVEQSLDLDFDAMISDLAPIDLLIQRSGRLQRHHRDRHGQRLAEDQPDQRGKPVLIVHAPEMTDEPQGDWYQSRLPKANFVYPDTLLLWRTAKILQQLGGWSMPADAQNRRGAREMLAFVYDDDGYIPDGLQNRANEALAETMSRADAGNFATLNLMSGYRNNHTWDEEARHVTRLGEESNTIYLARWQNGILSPWVDEAPYPWDSSSVKVSHRQLESAASTTDTALEKQLQQLKLMEKLFDEKSIVLPLVAVDNVWNGYGVDAKGERVRVQYTPNFGLDVIAKEKT